MVNITNVEFMQKDYKKFNLKIKNLEKVIPVSEKYSTPFLSFLT
jgi:hypothetical protein